MFSWIQWLKFTSVSTVGRGTVGASISCLMANCSTRGLTWINPQAYPQIFAEVARTVKVVGFKIYEDSAT